MTIILWVMLIYMLVRFWWLFPVTLKECQDPRGPYRCISSLMHLAFAILAAIIILGRP